MRLIDADALIDRWRKNLNITEKDTGAVFVGYGQIPALINNMPTIDAVPVVRCKDCKYNPKAARRPIYCFGWCWYQEEKDGYCSEGKRRDDGKENTD